MEDAKIPFGLARGRYGVKRLITRELITEETRVASPSLFSPTLNNVYVVARR